MPFVNCHVYIVPLLFITVSQRSILWMCALCNSACNIEDTNGIHASTMSRLQCANAYPKCSCLAGQKCLLEGLQIRCHRQGQQVQNVYIDECCKLRSTIKSVFDTNCTVVEGLQETVKTFILVRSPAGWNAREARYSYVCM